MKISKITKRKQILGFIKQKHEDNSTFIIKDVYIGVGYPAGHTRKIIKELKNKGVIEVVGGKGIRDSPYVFKVVKKLEE